MYKKKNNDRNTDTGYSENNLQVFPKNPSFVFVSLLRLLFECHHIPCSGMEYKVRTEEREKNTQTQ